MSQIRNSFTPDGRPALDVSGLPDSAFGPHDPVWWGNTLFIFIESMTVVLLLVTYFYLRRNFEAWPPVQPHTIPPQYHPVPALAIPTIELALVLLSCVPMVLIHRAAYRVRTAPVRLGMWIMFAVAVAAIVLRFYEFPGIHFKWNENAYASVVWVILGTHLTYLLAVACEFFIMALWVSLHALDEKHALDVTLIATYWYWVAATWLVIYVVVYWGARWL